MLDRRLRVLCVASGSSDGTLPRTGHLFGLQSELVSSLLLMSDCDWTGENDNNYIDYLYYIAPTPNEKCAQGTKEKQIYENILKTQNL